MSEPQDPRTAKPNAPVWLPFAIYFAALWVVMIIASVLLSLFGLEEFQTLLLALGLIGFALVATGVLVRNRHGGVALFAGLIILAAVAMFWTLHAMRPGFFLEVDRSD